MAHFPFFPGTNLQDLNLDWIIQKIKDFGNALNAKQDAPSSIGTSGQVLGLDSSLQPVWLNQSGGGGGTSDYTQLNNKPKINSVTLEGNKSLSDIGAIALPQNPANGQFLKWNGSTWIADNLPVYNGGVT